MAKEDEGSHLPNSQTNLAIALHVLSLFLAFHKHNSLPLGRYKPLSPVSCIAPRQLVSVHAFYSDDLSSGQITSYILQINKIYCSTTTFFKNKVT